MDKVSIIIPTYNRFTYLMNAISSIQEQTYKNIELIVINDCSTQEDYYKYDWSNKGIKIIHLNVNSKTKFGDGHICIGYVRNQGINISSGKYVAFCDDDDIWMPSKLELQINAIKKSGCKMSATDGLLGHGVYDVNKSYKAYNATSCYNTIKQIYKNKGSDLLDNGFPDIWTLDFLKVHNCIITSSVIVEKEILNKIGGFEDATYNPEDYECWMKILKYTNCIYLKDICYYYDSNHGDGRQY